MITKLNEAYQQYNVQEICDLFDHARSGYYYQSKDISQWTMIQKLLLNR